MPVDPREYDVGELRRLAGDEGDGQAPYRRERVRGSRAASRPAASRSLQAAQSRELRRLDAGRGKPYLRSLPASYAAEFLVVEWLEFLLAKGGSRGARGALTYYERVGWIDGDVVEQLRAYLPGVGAGVEAGDGRLDRDDHRISLIYVGRLADLSG